MTITEYAARRGVDPQTIQNAILAGRILRNPDGTIDPEIADRQWAENTRPKMLVGPTGSREQATGATELVEGMRYADARAIKEVIEAQRRKLELQVRAGELILRKDVERAAFTRFRMIRDACLNIPARVAPLLTGEKNEAKVFQTIEAEIRRVFQDFAETELT